MPSSSTVVRLSSTAGHIDVTLDPSSTAGQDLLSMLPISLTFEDFAGREKIAYPPRTIDVTGEPASSAGAGDLAIYVPWGNLALFYEGERGTPTGDLVRLGHFDATERQLAVLEAGPVTVDVVE
ncbi:cyclophilin-like fold protein [Cellulomonas uda]|uniref:Cyclophilin-like domain-containing protein n=1 Tax=Cellulomonas uda TaxID=1714 RepID=A0A4Y3K6W6_CELUD|nr:cyclophilin-like fold protein [Cellulomonas uda]NII66636.1 hypothetical protein [Cellulomonas uda]GEA79682.1 hypothetical protein CUD01_01260 [Cellulomonas uda]